MSGLGQYQIDARIIKFSTVMAGEIIVGGDMLYFIQKTDIGKFGLSKFA